MQASGWIHLLRRIPAHQVQNLSLVTTNGTELSIQNVVRIEEEVVLVRARVSGSSDAGRAFFIPYDQINYLGFQKPIKEDELRAMFDGPEAGPTAVPGTLPAGIAPPRVELTVPLPQENPVNAPTIPDLAVPQASSGSRLSGVVPVSQDAQPLPSKSKVLANLRARLNPHADDPSKR